MIALEESVAWAQHESVLSPEGFTVLQPVYFSPERVIREVTPSIAVLSVSIVLLNLPNCAVWNVLFNKHEYTSDIRSPCHQFGNHRESALLTPASHNSLHCHYRWHFTFFLFFFLSHLFRKLSWLNQFYLQLNGKCAGYVLNSLC